MRSVTKTQRLEPGDILVAQVSDPGWTATFSLATRPVIALGGQISHGAIVAREYGIPAAINVPGSM